MRIAGWLLVLTFASLTVLLTQVSGQTSEGWPRPGGDIAIVLVPEEEAALPAVRAVPRDDAAIEPRGISRAPEIRLISPQANARVSSPLALEIRFRAYHGAKIVPGSVKLNYVKEPPVNVTFRILEFVKADGISIPKVALARGSHLFEIEVVDSDGRRSTARFEFEVAD
ncbi:MAG: hypothetical protein HY269_04975 [Deltaproteobacteria bacterium]|nr:hypothetical protein [Deltaproteobacteria bacterium]